MKREKARLSQLASKLHAKNTAEIGRPDFRKTEFLDPNPPHGERGDFRKLTVTLPPDVYEQLVQESARRKIARAENHLLAAIVREAVVSYMSALGKP